MKNLQRSDVDRRRRWELNESGMNGKVEARMAEEGADGYTFTAC